MFDPNPSIWGKGWQRLRDAGIETRVFDDDLMNICEEMNRDFIRAQKPDRTQ
jgi:pyrimidine deaminase RibD-like protein